MAAATADRVKSRCLLGGPRVASGWCTGFTYDVGALFDFTLLPLVNVGVHAAYNQIPGRDDPSLQWVSMGGHVELVF